MLATRRISHDKLYDLYINQHLTIDEIAGILGHSRGLVWKKLRVYNIPLRSRSESMMLKGHGTAWKGGKYKSNGYVYVYVPDHPDCDGRGYILEHRLVMEQKLGRRLLLSEQSHHLNGIKDDNRPDNLTLATVDGHTMLTKWCNDCRLRKDIVELQEQVKLLKWQVKNLNKLLYGTDSPAINDILTRVVKYEQA